MRELADQGVQVVCLDNFLTGMPGNVAHLLPDAQFRLVRCDVTDYVHVPGDVDLVLHFASPASPVDYLRLPIHTLKVGSLGTLHALGLAREKKARFVLASTSEVYDDPLEHPQQETYWGNVNPIGPRGVYDEAKRYAEALTTAYRTSGQVKTAIVRIFNSFGPRIRPNDGRAGPRCPAARSGGPDPTARQPPHRSPATSQNQTPAHGQPGHGAQRPGPGRPPATSAITCHLPIDAFVVICPLSPDYETREGKAPQAGLHGTDGPGRTPAPVNAYLAAPMATKMVSKSFAGETYSALH